MKQFDIYQTIVKIFKYKRVINLDKTKLSNIKMIISEICLACKWAIGNDCQYDDNCWSFSPSITCFEPKFDSSYSNPKNFLNQWLIVETTMKNLEKVIIKKNPIDYQLKTQLKAIIQHYDAVKKLKRLYKVLLRDFEQFSHIFNKSLELLTLED